jgi:opacity protein-like surface antigen
MRPVASVLLSLSLCLVALPGTASAQADRGASAGASVSATNMDSHTSWSFSGSFEYRVNRVAGFEVEATAVPSLQSDFPGVSILSSTASLTSLTGSFFSFNSESITTSPLRPTVFPAPRFENQKSRAVFFTNNIKVHIPTTADRIDPYFVAGGGIANVRRTADFVQDPFILNGLPSGIVLPPSLLQPRISPLRSSSTSLALTVGGGAAFRVWSRAWIEADLRMFRMLGTEDQNAGRFGVGLRYRF